MIYRGAEMPYRKREFEHVTQFSTVVLHSHMGENRNRMVIEISLVFFFFEHPNYFICTLKPLNEPKRTKKGHVTCALQKPVNHNILLELQPSLASLLH